ncbi:lysosomal-trafficking regulator isoform X2 [Bicyclus anynana]|uniref:Lysosomal-trafficking regulator isoform X2 n=1 Tax=Bicyclus anynana TaxID=110368 RepID=A0ABM3LKC2_BICAN|nr:lysosomal-trafficking regulator isoform X2 [Bicyclus anynana]
MSVEEEPDALKIYWDHFFKAETGTYEKSTWLELFLAEFIIRLNDGQNPKKLINFCPVSGVVTLVGCELLCGVHRVTSSINTHYSVALPSFEPPAPAPVPAGDTNGAAAESKAEEAPRPASVFSRMNTQSSAAILRSYLLGGVAWRCLVLLRALGVEGLSCCRQLSSVLIWLFGETCAGGEPRAASPPPVRDGSLRRPPIQELFSSRIWAKQKPYNVSNSTGSSEKSYLLGRVRTNGQPKSDAESKIKKRSTRSSEQSSESGDSNDDLEILNRSMTIKVCSPNDDFDYFNSPIRSPDYLNQTLYIDPLYSPRKAKPKADDYMTEKHRDIINSEISTFEFTLIITDLLQELCKAESSLSGSEGSQISMQCINFSLKNLCSLQFGSLPAQSAPYEPFEMSRVKVALTELLIVSLDQVLIHSDLCAKLINNGILPMLLRILEDVICKSGAKYNTKERQNRAKEMDTKSETESANLLKFVFGIAYSITAFFHCLLMQCRSVEKLREFTEQFKLYGECLKGGLLKECMELMIRIPGADAKEEAVILIRKLIDSIGKLISAMKRVRSEVIHSAACPRSRHKACRQRVAAGMHHHHDILGEAGTGLPLPSACCVSVLYGTLTSLVPDEEVSAQKTLRNRILRVMLKCGVCCCFSPSFLMENIVRLMLTHSNVASLCLQLLEHTVYGDLGASVLIPKVTDQLPCSICEQSDSNRDLGRKYCPHGVSPIDRKSVWSFLIHYNSLLQLDNHNDVLHATVRHLLKVTPKCRMEMKYELLFSVIYPTFIVSKHRYTMRVEESAYFLTVSCLNIFASLLNTVSFAEQFIQKGGLSYVLELVSLPEFSNQCCAILEIAIIVEIFKLIKENVELTYFREMRSLASVQILFKSLTDMTEKCYKIYKTKIPIEKFDELCDISKEKEMLAIPTSDQSRQTRPATTPIAIKSTFAYESTTEETVEDHIEVLKNVCTFWKSCAGLCLYSPMFREYAVGQPVFAHSYALLKLLLHYLCNCDCAPAEAKVLIKIMESLLTVQFSVSDATSGRSKQTSCAVVRSALSARACGGVRALCDALVGVALAAPSSRHAMPRLTPLKVPPLFCPSGSSSPECSSSEESAVGPYASEHSESRALPDDGYEADVEIGMQDAPTKTRKLSESLAVLNNVPGLHPQETLLDCPEYSESGELAHPELCVIVVDILSQLIDRLLSSEQYDKEQGEEVSRVCSGLARAWGARLAGARAPPLLLARLLAHDAPPARLLADTNAKYAELQRSILELVVAVAAHSIEAAELCALLRLFAAERPPLALLLRALRRLVERAAPHAPDCILSFPIDVDPEEYPAEEAVGSSFNQQAELSARRLRQAHSRAGVWSSWAASAARCAVGGAGWTPWMAGFGVAIWLRLAPHHSPPACEETEEWQEEPPDPDGPKSPRKEPPAKAELLHVFSVGHDSLVFELWVNTSNGELTVRLTRPDAQGSKLVSAARSRPGLGARWSCLALNVAERVHKRRIHIQVRVTSVVCGELTERLTRPDAQGSKLASAARSRPGLGARWSCLALNVAERVHKSRIHIQVRVTSVVCGELTERLTRPDAQGSKLVSAARSRPGLGARWSCLALNVAERVHKRRIHIQVTIYVNGRECETLSLLLQGILVRKATPSSVLLGQAGRTRGAGALHVAHVRVFRTPALSAPAALHLAAHPPDLPCQIPCESANYPSIITPELLDMDIDWDSVYEISSATLRELHESLLLSFCAHSPEVMSLYHQAPAVPTVFGSRGWQTAGGACGEAPDALRVRWAGPPRAARRRGLAPALLALGGPEVLLYLFARVVELEGSAEEQAGALQIALRACGADARLGAQLHAGAALDLLLPVLAAPACRVSHHMLQVIFESACSGVVLAAGGGGGAAATLRARTDAVLLEPRLLVLLVRAWRHFDCGALLWEADGARAHGSPWELALAALGALLHPAHPRLRYNHYQASRVDLLRHLLLACKERFLNSERPAFGQETSVALVALVRALLGHPPLLCHLALLADFLLLMHQASDTFVTHSRANYYFLLSADTPETCDFNLLNFIHKRHRTKTDNKTYDTTDKSSSSSVSEDAGDQHVRGSDSDKTDPDSADSTKQMKGLINEQIRERRHKLSSTSEASDGTTEKSTEESADEAEGAGAEASEGADAAEGAGAEAEAEAERALDGYIVVDSDDVSHTTVDLFTSGIYQQRRVRAGAEPGWQACEGLLLLLRDAIAALPDHMLVQAVAAAIQPDTLVVLANHRQAGVRAAVVRAVCALQRRHAAALPHHCLVQLANQISLYPASWELAAACAALLTRRDVPLEDQLDEDVWRALDEEAAHRSPPLLALLPLAAGAADVPLAHNIAALARRLVDKASLKALNEVALVEVAVRAVRAVGRQEERFEGRELLLDDLTELLARLAGRLLAGNHSMQGIVDMHNMLRFVECERAAGAGAPPDGVVGAARAAQVALFAAQLDHLELRLRLHHHQPRPAGLLSTVLTSAVEGGLSARSEAAELAARHGAVLARAVAFLVTRPESAPLQPEAELFERLLRALLAGAHGGDGASRLFGGAQDGGALAALFWWAASPAPAARPLQPRLLRALYHAPAAALRALAPRAREPAALRKLAVYLLSLLQHVHLRAERGAGVELAITDWARDWAVGAQAELAERVRGPALPAEAGRLLAEDRARWARQHAGPRARAAVLKAACAREAQARAATEAAMGATRGVVETQNGERKAFLEHLRRAHARSAAAGARWQRIVDAHTHELGVWHSARGYPRAWQLDSTEGPGRVRVRLRRAHLRIPARFLQPAQRHKAAAALLPGPLRAVLGAGARGGAAARLALGETVAHTARAVRVSVAAEAPGELLLTDRCLHFVPEEEGPGGEGAASWSLGAVARVATRRWCLQERALELFLCCGRALMLAFADTAERAAFLAALARAHLPNKTEPDSLAEAMNQWRVGAITNWEYLMILNGLAGRSYNDLMQYPVFPFVLADYSSKLLDLHSPASFRDLAKPVAVQHKDREQHYVATYSDLSAARRDGCSPLLSRQPHHYASLYSNSGGVLHYLVRLPPFTELFLQYQDDNFDMPDRTFHSLATTWRLITRDSPTDVKELIPELFYLPELFYNTEGLELGVRQCGLRVDAVQLPPWAADARLFTLVHRQALEAPLVTERLPLWVDLVFGYKQTGQAAVDAINVFPACTYYGFDPSSLEEEVDRLAAAAMVRTYGQAPRQLLRAPHPQRAPELAPRAATGACAGAVGVRWGRYCGSPALAAPGVAARRVCAGAARLQPLAHARAVAACPPACALLVRRDEWSCSGEGASAGAGGEALCAVTWAHADHAVRVRRRRDLPPETLLHLSPQEQVTAGCGWSGRGGWGASGALGLSTGRVLALRAGARVSVHALHAHRAPVTQLVLCPPASLLVSADADGLIVLWDLNELTYIRTLPNRDMLPLRCLAVSETLSDVATAHAPAGGGGALLRVHTVNARFVGSARVPEAATCAAYSAAPEGVSVNCVALGLATGAVRLYSAWDLRPLAYVPPPARAAPLLSLAYGADSQLLFACYADGAVLAWESTEGGAKPAPVRILPAHALL